MPRRKRANTVAEAGLLPPLPPAKERIKAAASKLYPVHGIQFPLFHIANEAQTNIETINKYFGSQDGLVIDFLRHCELEIEEAWEGPKEQFPKNPLEQIRYWIDGERILAKDGDWSCFDLLRSAAFLLPYRNSRALAYIRMLKRKERDLLAERCKAACLPDPKGLANKLMLLVDGATAGNLLHGLSGPAVELLKAADAIIGAHRTAEAQA